MRLVHPTADRLVVAPPQRIADIEHTALLADDVAGTLVILLRNLPLHGIELLHRGAAQELLSQHPGHPLARSAAVVVGRPHQLVLHARIEQHQTVSLRVEGKVLILERAAVETNQIAPLAEDRGELVHDAAVDAAVVVLGRLADFRQFELVDAALPQLVEGKGIGRFERRRRRHARTQRHVARKDRIEAADAAAALLHLTADAEDVARPRLCGLVRLAQTELRGLVHVERPGPHALRAVGTDGCHDTLVHRSGEDEATVVVRMFADEVDASR